MLDRIEQTLEKLYRHYGEQNWWNDKNRLSDWVSMILIQQKMPSMRCSRWRIF